MVIVARGIGLGLVFGFLYAAMAWDWRGFLLGFVSGFVLVLIVELILNLKLAGTEQRNE